MPVEIREILFLLPEFQAALAVYDGGQDRPVLQQKDIEKVQFSDLVHTRDMERLPWERQRSFLTALGVKRAPTEQGLMILLHKRGFWGQAQTGFFLPDRIGQEVLIAACRRSGVMLPKRGRKETFARDLMVGLRIHLDDTGMELALA